MKHSGLKRLSCLLLSFLMCISTFSVVSASSQRDDYIPACNWDDFTYTSTSLLTPGGRSVPCRRYTSDFNSNEANAVLNNDISYFDKYGIEYVILDMPTRGYNCYSYAFYSRNPSTNNYVIMQPTGGVNTEGTPLYAYWQDAHFVNTPKEPEEAEVGDLILYYSNVSQMTVCHAGVVSEVSNGIPTKVISKWGMSCLYEHRTSDVPRAYRVTGGTEYYGEVFYEVYSYAINHSYGAWTSISSTQHRRSCEINGCTVTQTGSHSIDYTYNSSTHQKYCTECNYSTSSSHSYTYTNTGSSSTHTASCVCGYSKSQSHSLNWTSVSDTRHKCVCSKCSYTATSNHTFGAWVSAGVSGHSHTCSLCSKTITQAHIFSGTCCTVCGYDGPGVAALLKNALLPLGCKSE